ncbi:PhzF family phenazine biosynthesis protein [Aestuariibacter salexigens]|uniref:PhzF family phenazine biosynthesis protein n=1 Tax=Aestuariibacter salexigens TaxID=226010 RepID=UPI00041E3FD6|nr:PhzF family phenazine biosynthesis protein [Aestuariibacter salexigens]
MELTLYQVDAFTQQVFGGNPAAVVPLPEWLPDTMLQKIAEENNLSETAFFVAENEGFRLRWFTPEAEVDLCGHATLATAHTLFHHCGYEKSAVRFFTNSGGLTVRRDHKGYIMDFPASMPEPVTAPPLLLEALGCAAVSIHKAFDYIVELESESLLASLTPDFFKLSKLDGRGVVVTARGEQYDIVARCFFPKLRVNEDPVTGSAFCELTPFWADKSAQHAFHARQLSSRGGDLFCELKGDRVYLTGYAADYMQATISL